jgi:ABC-type antimicrobial peptide transport system permease subunit
MMNMETYQEVLNWTKESVMDTPVDKIMINLARKDDATILAVQEYLKNYYAADYDFKVDQIVQKANLISQSSELVEVLFNIILTVTILICLFGLFAGLFASLLERMFEIGILRAMGLKSHEVQNEFILESLTIVIAAGTLGMLIGSFLAYLLFTLIGTITEMPVIYLLNIGTVVQTYALTVGACIVGTALITRKIKGWTVMEVLRRTF